MPSLVINIGGALKDGSTDSRTVILAAFESFDMF
jgi:hypothetical protein